MSTRAIIKVEGVGFAAVYKHCDGYPDGTLPWLQEFNKDFAANRGDDPQYKFAQLLRSSARDAEKFNLDDSKHTGWGVFPLPIGWDAAYVYTLHKDGTVTVEANE